MKLPYMTVLAGDDSIGRDRSRDDLVAAFVKESGPAGEEFFDAAREPLNQFLERVITPSLFETFRIFYLSHVQDFSADELAEVTALFGYDIPDVCIMLQADACRPLSGRSELGKEFEQWLKAFEAQTDVVPGRFVLKQFPKPRDYEIAGWLVSHVHGLFKRRIASADAEYFVDLVGSDFDRIYSELQKLDIFLPEGKPIDRGAIETVVEPTRTMNAFELAHALGKKDLPRALSIVDSMYNGQFYAPMVIGALFQHFWVLYKIRAFQHLNDAHVQAYQQAVKSRNRDATNKAALAIGIAVGLLTEKQSTRVYPAIIKPALIEQALSFSEGHLRMLLRRLREYDVGIKTGTIADTKGSFQTLCFGIVRQESSPTTT